MKKLYILLLALVSFVPLVAKHEKSPEEVASFIRGMKEQGSFTISKELAQKLKDVKEQKMALVIAEKRKMAAQATGEKKARLERVISLMEQLLAECKAMPAEAMTKSLEHFREWMNYKAKKAIVLSDMFNEFARQAKSEKLKEMLEDKAEHIAEKAEMLRAGLAK